MTETNNTKRDPFIEAHRHRDHAVEWRFTETLPVSLPENSRNREYQIINVACEAVKASATVDKLIKAVATLLPGKVVHQISMVGVRFSTSSKKDFDLVNVLVRSLLADVDPDAFTAEIKTAAEAALAAQDRKVEAETRADYLLGEALAARDQAHRMATEKAEEAFANEIYALRVRYIVLVEKFVGLCQQEAARIMADAGEFADLGDDAQTVFDLTNEITAAQPLKFSGPRIHP
jgi:hypothetical protein